MKEPVRGEIGAGAHRAQLCPHYFLGNFTKPGRSLKAAIGPSHHAARIVVVGVCMERDQIEPLTGISKELNIQFVLGYAPEEFAATLSHLAEGQVNADPLITGKVGVEGVAKAFEDLASPETHAKILVEPWHS